MGHHAFTVDDANDMLPEVRAALKQIYAGRRRITAGQMQRLGRLDDPARHKDSALDF